MFPLGRRLALACAGVAAAAAALSGCGGGGSKPVSLPSISPSPPPTPTAAVGAKAAISSVIRQYYALLNAQTTVLNGQSLAALMTDACTCRRVATSTIDAARKHEVYFGRTTVVSITPVVDSPSSADALVEYDYTVSGLKDANGHVINRTAARRGSRLMFIFQLADGHWLISEVRSINNGQPA